MKLGLQIIFILASLLTFVFVILTIRKYKLNINDSIVWILWALLLLILSVFPNLSKLIADFLGFESTSNFIIVAFVFFSYLILFFQNVKISELREKNKKLVQELSLEEKLQEK